MDGLLDALGSLGTAIVDAYNDKIKDKLNNTIDQYHLQSEIDQMVDREIEILISRCPQIDQEGLCLFLKKDHGKLLIASAISRVNNDSFYHQCQYHAHAETEDSKAEVEHFIDQVLFSICQHYYEQVPPQYQLLHSELMSYLQVIIDALHVRNDEKANMEQFIYEPTLPDQIIARKVVPIKRKDTTEGLSIIEALQNDKHIVLLGSAGSGKSVFLADLYYKLKELHYVPIHIPLNLFSGTSENDVNPINAAVNYMFADKPITPYTYAYLLDGFDELNSENLNKFSQMLKANEKKLSSIPIIISSRWNFYQYQSDRHHGTLSGFEPYELVPLDSESINAYLSQRSVDTERFFDQINAHHLKNLVTNPFYLSNLCQFFSRNSVLPNESELMNRIISELLSADNEKYQFSGVEIAENEYAIKRGLITIALFMQLMQEYSITEVQFQTIITDATLRRQIKCAGLWQKNSQGRWAFGHNNFREYLAACYLFTLDLNQVIDKAMIHSKLIDMYHIKPSWVNVISYLAQMEKQEALLNWVLENMPEGVLLFDQERLTIMQREDAIRSILVLYNSEQYFLNPDQQEQLAELVQSSNSIDLIISEIMHPCSNYGHLNALRILKNVNGLYQRESQTHEVLYQLLLDNQTEDYVQQAIMDVITRHRLYSEVDLDQLINNFGNTDDPYVADHLVELLLSAPRPAKYMTTFVGFISIKEKGELSNWGLLRRIREGLLTADDVASVEIALSAAIQFHPLNGIEREAVLVEKLVEKCVSMQKMHPELTDFFVTLISEENVISHREILSCIAHFFIGTNQEALFISTFYSKMHQYYFVLADIMDNAFAIAYVATYRNGDISIDDIKSLMDCMEPTQDGYAVLDEVVYKVDGCNYVSPRRQLHSQEMQAKINEVQRYFDALFDRDVYAAIVGELLDCLDDVDGDENILLRGRVKYYQAAYLCWNDLRQSFPNKAALVEWNNRIRWDLFALNTIADMLTTEKTIIVSSEQKDLIRGFIDQYLNTYDITLTQTGNTILYSTCVDAVLKLISYFDFSYSQSIVKKMLLIPADWYTESHSHYDISPYVLKHLSKVEISNEIVRLIKEGKAPQYQIDCFFHFLSETALKDDDVCTKAFQCILSGDDYYPSQAIEYIKKVYGEQYLLDNTLGKINSPKRILYLSGFISSQTASADLNIPLWKVYHTLTAEEDLSHRRECLQHLIRFGDADALIEFGMLLKKKSGKRFAIEMTESDVIRSIQLPQMAPAVFSVFRISTQEGLNDGFFGLDSACNEALANIAAKNDAYEQILYQLEEELSSCQEEYRRKLYILRQTLRKQFVIRTEEKLDFRHAKETVNSWLSESVF